jgi:Tfp pilus assembly protein FimT
MNLTQNQRRRGLGGYSLIELLLTMSLLLLFTGLAVVSLNTLSQSSALTEGSSRFETMLRFARAEASHTGRRVRVNFLQDTNQVTSATALNYVGLTWEPDPLGEPDVFQDLLSTQWGVDQVNETVGVETVKLVENTDAQPANEDDCEGDADLADADLVDLPDAEPGPPPSITFNPNGSCDSAEITLADRGAADDRRVIVKIEGFTGSISRVEPPDKEAGTAPETPDTERRPSSPESK